ncbi:Sugar transferase involved in LPS biosynthesis (colanic, teichoic acid) [Maribacter dokdonensis]|uniref:Sugar transferase involved in LPS biosynthesis (Colanic, teichoic acid) n=1 Tax=Maribacter dokdonensis TaxID=320912 RepID=A0ABY0UID3_9FLAO|nr:sugar transferase [Maribacter dokdonensis]SDS73522.1 Sugar transferase involved in LPS biosynthesis (colanic, teichoic acid) [Maribacter dokdonensis]
MYPLIKRFLDIIVSFSVLVLALPLLIAVALILYVVNQGKPFFYQQRPGKNERIFKIVKFKSMNDKKGSDGQLLPDVERITTFGNFVRKSSLDELPQLWNVLKGDMSLVGPRPLLVSYLPLYNEEQKKRHLVRPGITGWAQVNGRNTISWEKKFEYDVWYVEHISFMLDMKIYLKTLLKVIKRADISASENTTMEKFVGNN